jgi:putative endonuclease
MAAEWLALRGWTILARRWRTPAGELDLVVLDPDGVLVAVEVKLRSGSRAGEPAEAIDRRRLHRLRAALSQFRALPGGGMRTGLRIDLVAITTAPDGRWRLVHQRAIDAW